MSRVPVHKDRSAVSALAVILIVILVVVAGIGTYALLSENESGTDKNDARSIAPGTTGVYEVNGSGGGFTVEGTITFKIVAQNSDRYLVEYQSAITVNGTGSEETDHDFVSKVTGAPADAERIGTSKVSTIDGDKDLEIWEYYEGGVLSKDYIDPDSKIAYRSTSMIYGIPLSADLSSLSMIWQDSYEQSSSIGDNLSYHVTGQEGDLAYLGTSTTELVAESPDGYWQKVTVSLSGMYVEESYSLVDGIKTDRKYVGNDSITTIHGTKTVEKETWTDGHSTYLAYVDPDTGLTYRMEIRAPDTFITMELESINSIGPGDVS